MTTASTFAEQRTLSVLWKLWLSWPFAVSNFFFVFSLVQLWCQVGVLYLPPSSSPVLGVSLLLTALVRITPDAVHPPHSWSSFCPRTSHYHLHRLLHLIFFIHPQNMSNLVCFAFSLKFSTRKSLLILLLLSLFLSVTIDPPQHSHFCCFQCVSNTSFVVLLHAARAWWFCILLTFSFLCILLWHITGGRIIATSKLLVLIGASMSDYLLISFLYITIVTMLYVERIKVFWFWFWFTPQPSFHFFHAAFIPALTALPDIQCYS